MTVNKFIENHYIFHSFYFFSTNRSLIVWVFTLRSLFVWPSFMRICLWYTQNCLCTSIISSISWHCEAWAHITYLMPCSGTANDRINIWKSITHPHHNQTEKRKKNRLQINKTHERSKHIKLQMSK